MKPEQRELQHAHCWNVCEQLVKRWLSPANKWGIISRHYGWNEEDFASELYAHILTHDRNQTEAYRRRWLETEWDWFDLSQQKQFRGWTKKECKSFIGRLYHRLMKQNENEEAKKAMLFILGEDLTTFPDDNNKEVQMEKEDTLTAIHNYVENFADEREKFIYFCALHILEPVYENDRVINYPFGSVSRKTFYHHRQAFYARLQGAINK